MSFLRGKEFNFGEPRWRLFFRMKKGMTSQFCGGIVSEWDLPHWRVER
jgi:hypothetical protein